MTCAASDPSTNLDCSESFTGIRDCGLQGGAGVPGRMVSALAVHLKGPGLAVALGDPGFDGCFEIGDALKDVTPDALACDLGVR